MYSVMLSLYYFSLCGGNPQYPRTVHIMWTSDSDSFQEILIPAQMKTSILNVNCSEARNKL